MLIAGNGAELLLLLLLWIEHRLAVLLYTQDLFLEVFLVDWTIKTGCPHSSELVASFGHSWQNSSPEVEKGHHQGRLATRDIDQEFVFLGVSKLHQFDRHLDMVGFCWLIRGLLLDCSAFDHLVVNGYFKLIVIGVLKPIETKH